MKIGPHILIIFILFSCTGNSEIKSTTLVIDSMIIKGQIEKDSIFHDTMLFYDLENQLRAKKVYKEGKQQGISIEYYDNGMPSVISNYADGLKLGIYSAFDTSGMEVYRGYYYYDLTVGPVIYFDNGLPKRYYFIDLNDHDLLHIYYPEWRGVKPLYDKMISFSSSEGRVDSAEVLSVLLYLMKPPGLRIDYSVVKILNEIERKEVFIMSLESSLPFINFSLPTLNDTSSRYAVKASIYDSILRKESVIYKEI